MTKEEAWLVWMNATKTTDTPLVTDFDVIKKSSWWAAFEAGWDAAALYLYDAIEAKLKEKNGG